MTQNKEQLEQELLDLLTEQEYDLQYNKFNYLYPDTGKFKKEAYPVHWEYMQAGDRFMERALIAGNGTGKTWGVGSYEMTAHLTGKYPSDWEGRKFLNPIKAWCVGVSNAQVKRVMQGGLLGSMRDVGSGMIPKKLIVLPLRMKSGVADVVEVCYVRHVSGGLSECTFMSCEQDVKAFMGDSIDFAWMDEEPKNMSYYAETLARLRNPVRAGCISSTFTPLSGMSDVVLSFLPDGVIPEGGVHHSNPSKYVRNISVYDVPHLPADYVENIKRSYPAHELNARLYGIPSLGSGVIYPYPEDDIFIKPNIDIQPWWPTAYGFDVGWNKTAVVWISQDPKSKIYYVWSEHYVGETLPALHASAIKARGEWIQGAIDPASNGGSQRDGLTLFSEYENEGLHITVANNAVEAGILRTGQLMATSRLKIFSTCVNLRAEYRMYCRDEKGKIIKKRDHALDALRYGLMSFGDIASAAPDEDYKEYKPSYNTERDPITGY